MSDCVEDSSKALSWLRGFVEIDMAEIKVVDTGRVDVGKRGSSLFMPSKEYHRDLGGELARLAPVSARVEAHEFLEERIAWIPGKFRLSAQAQDELRELTWPRIPDFLGVQGQTTLQPDEQISYFVRVCTLDFCNR
jgi:hypothetical protein